jgi:hypothetical protein
VQSLFERARKVAPAAVARAHGVKLHARGLRARGPCPLCGAGKSGEPFMADVKGPLWHCFACGESGDSVALEQELGGHRDRISAARALTGEDERTTAAPREFDREEPPESETVDSQLVADHIAGGIRPARGTIVEGWFAARGIDPARIDLSRLAFHPRCPVSAWRRDRGPDSVRHAPAMVAPLRPAPDASLCGVHVTYLSPNGRAKAQLRRRDGTMSPARKMFGRARLAGCFLTAMDGPGPLIVGEGLETVLSYAAEMPIARALAVLSLDNLQGRAVRDAEGCVPLWNLRSDPEAAPMLVPDSGEVRLLIDADMKPIRARIQRERRGLRERGWIDGLTRSQICATLAVQAWRRAGGRPAAYRAPAGFDFNDLAQVAP